MNQILKSLKSLAIRLISKLNEKNDEETDLLAYSENMGLEYIEENAKDGVTCSIYTACWLVVDNTDSEVQTAEYKSK